MKIARRWLLPTFALSALLLAACGGNGKDDESVVSDGPSLSASDSVQFVDLAQSTANLQELTSFRFDLSMALEFDLPEGGEDPLGDAFAAALLDGLGNLSFNGVIASPEEFELHANAFGEDFGYVQIGEQAWVNQGAGWEPSLPETAATPFGPSMDELWGELLPDEVLQAAVVGTETVNGVEAVHYSFDKESLAGIAGSFGGELSPADLEAFEQVSEVALDMWLTEGDIPVRMLFALAATGEAGESGSVSFELNLYDLNSPSLNVEPPA
jgi:hypothetical protein